MKVLPEKHLLFALVEDVLLLLPHLAVQAFLLSLTLLKCLIDAIHVSI